MGRKDEKTKTKADMAEKAREKSSSYGSSDPFKVQPNRPSKKSNKSSVRPR